MSEFSYSRWSLETGPVTRLFLVALFTVIALLLAGASEVFQSSEAREGAVVWRIISSGEWILPLRHGESIPSKPPLFHWLSAVLYLTLSFGSAYSEFFVRLPSILAAGGLLIVTSNYAQRQAGTTAAVFVVVILSSCYGFSRLALDGRVDMLFVLLTTWATLKALEFAQSQKRQMLLPFAFLSGAAVLAKGPLGLLAPFFALFLGTAVYHGRRSILGLVKPELLISILLPGLWYFLAYLQAGDLFLSRQIVFENITRFFGGDGINNRGTFLFYLPHLVGQAAPWSLLFLLYLFFLARSPRFLPAESKKTLLLHLIIFGTLFFFLSLSAGKRRSYLLLLLPHIALILALRLASTYDRFKREGRLSILSHRFRYETLTWGVLIWFIGTLPGLSLFFLGENEGRIIEAMLPGAALLFRDFQNALRYMAYPAVFAVLALSSLFFWLMGHKTKNLHLLGLALVMLLQTTVTLYTQLWLTTKSQSRSPKNFAERVDSLLPDNVRLTVPTVNLDESYDPLLFYLKREVKFRVTPPFPRGLYLTKAEDNLTKDGQVLLRSQGLRRDFTLVKR